MPEVPEPVPEVPAPPVPLPDRALVPPEEEPVLGALVAAEDEDELEEVLVPEEALVPLPAELVDPVGPVVPVLAEALAGPEVGTVSGGEPEVSDAADPLPPQAARPATVRAVASSVRILEGESMGRTS